MKPIPINGIRLGPGLVWTGQDSSRSRPLFPVCQAMSTQRINLICAGLHREPGHERFSGCVESRYREVLARLADDDGTVPQPADVTQVSVYPHHRRFVVPLVLMKMLADAGISFYHLVSSPAVMSVVIDTRYQDSVIALLETTFDLPASHTPYIQEIDQDISALLKKYPETRSTYVEEKIKTYGIQLTPGVRMRHIRDAGERLLQIQQDLATDTGPEARFHLVSVMRISGGGLDAVFVLDPGQSLRQEDPGKAVGKENIGRPVAGDSDIAWEGDSQESVDLITFHGPHFGDRYRILQAALNCLEIDRVPLRAAACAGASISLVFPAGSGPLAQTALAKGFDAP
jgi:hypothetical protein